MQVWPTQIEGVGGLTTWSLVDKGDLIPIIHLFIIILAVLGLHCCVRVLSICGQWGLLSGWGAGAADGGGFLALKRRLSSCGHRLSCSEARGIFLNQGLNLCLLDWQVDSYPLDHRGSPLDLISFQENLPDTQSGPGTLGRHVVRLQLSPLTK